MIKSTLTDKWQTTIPAEVRKALHLKPRQQLIYELTDGAVLVKPQPETLKELFTRQSPQALKALRDTAVIQSAESSNRIEGVTVAQARLASARPSETP